MLFHLKVTEYNRNQNPLFAHMYLNNYLELIIDLVQ